MTPASASTVLAQRHRFQADADAQARNAFSPNPDAIDPVAQQRLARQRSAEATKGRSQPTTR